jgi:lipoyl-dependent peroxiredoxin
MLCDAGASLVALLNLVGAIVLAPDVKRFFAAHETNQCLLTRSSRLSLQSRFNTGGRNGHSETTDHSVSVNLSVRKEMGGPGLPGATTPEHLVAAGYAACSCGAIEFPRQHKKDIKGTVVTCHTSVGPREGGGFGISVKMQVKIPMLPKDEAVALVEEKHEKIGEPDWPLTRGGHQPQRQIPPCPITCDLARGTDPRF